jgi:hypothetical protein
MHYRQFHGTVGPDTPITPDELDHYGMILTSTDSPTVVGFGGWQYFSALWNQPGFPEKLRKVRDNAAAHE